MSNVIRLDQGAQIKNLFTFVRRAYGVEVHQSGVESNNSLGVRKQYYYPLQMTFPNVKWFHLGMPDATLLSHLAKCMIDTLGSEGVLPATLVFGEYPFLCVFGDTTRLKNTKEERPIIYKEARQEIERHIARSLVTLALRHSVHQASDEILQICDKVLVWREKVIEHCIKELKGPYTVFSVDRKKRLVYFKNDRESNPKPSEFAQVKRYQTAEEAVTA